MSTKTLDSAILNPAAGTAEGIIRLFNIGADHSVRKQVEAERKAPSGWAVCSGTN